VAAHYKVTVRHAVWDEDSGGNYESYTKKWIEIHHPHTKGHF